MKKLDRIVIEHGDSRMYLHRIQAHPDVLWAAPTADVEEAMTFTSAEQAEEFLAVTYPGSEEFELRYLAAVVARDDQEYALYLRELRS